MEDRLVRGVLMEDRLLSWASFIVSGFQWMTIKARPSSRGRGVRGVASDATFPHHDSSASESTRCMHHRCPLLRRSCSGFSFSPGNLRATVSVTSFSRIMTRRRLLASSECQTGLPRCTSAAPRRRLPSLPRRGPCFFLPVIIFPKSPGYRNF